MFSQEQKLKEEKKIKKCKKKNKYSNIQWTAYGLLCV